MATFGANRARWVGACRRALPLLLLPEALLLALRTSLPIALYIALHLARFGALADAVPLHLLTLEEGAVYLKHLAQDGLLAFHISNGHLNLGEVAARFATSLQLAVIGRADLVPPDDVSGRSSSVWVVMARERDTLNGPAARPGWKWLTPDLRRASSDDFSSLWGIVRWSQ
jgi:hypothetical protein